MGQPDEASYLDKNYPVVTGIRTDATAVLDGFTITGGNAAGGVAWRGDDAKMVKDGGRRWSANGGSFTGGPSPTRRVWMLRQR